MASYTSVSLMSTSAWDNAGGCPVVSPSKWNPVVASNLCVIALHDHSGSAGEGTTGAVCSIMFPSHDAQYIYPWFPVSSTCWTVKAASDWPGGGYISSSSLGAVLEYDIYVKRTNAAGETYTVQWFATSASGGAATLGCCIAGIHADLGGPACTAGIVSMPSGSFSLTNGIVYYQTQIFTANVTGEGIKGNGRTTIRFKIENDGAGLLAGEEVRIGYIKFVRTVT